MRLAQQNYARGSDRDIGSSGVQLYTPCSKLSGLEIPCSPVIVGLLGRLAFVADDLSAPVLETSL